MEINIGNFKFRKGLSERDRRIAVEAARRYTEILSPRGDIFLTFTPEWGGGYDGHFVPHCEFRPDGGINVYRVSAAVYGSRRDYPQYYELIAEQVSGKFYGNMICL